LRENDILFYGLKKPKKFFFFFKKMSKKAKSLKKFVEQFLSGYRKHGNPFSGISEVLKTRSLSAIQKKLDLFEQKEIRISQELSKVRAEKEKYVAEKYPEVIQSRKIARAMLPEKEAEDFAGE